MQEYQEEKWKIIILLIINRKSHKYINNSNKVFCKISLRLMNLKIYAKIKIKIKVIQKNYLNCH